MNTIVTNLLTADLLYESLIPVLTPGVKGAVVESVEQVRPDDYVTSRFTIRAEVEAFDVTENLIGGVNLAISFANDAEIVFTNVEAVILDTLEPYGDEEGEPLLIIYANGAQYHVLIAGEDA